MTLDELDASFVAPEGRHGVAVQFRCPGCRRERIVIPLANPVDGGAPDPSMNHRGVLWQRLDGTKTLESLTLSPSVDFKHVNGTGDAGDPWHECRWHGWVRNGRAESV